ncbi:MAG: LacI family DNA-binding transcriptional regulator [Planctomycetota bacterium]|jgi:DNA-binding LacI/PurR family transcriptional regulator|nr:LacI family DNA-binding transcriptional regulator [Planctomycetota bacterium]
MAKRVTIQDVANRAGCSRQSAGFILGGQSHKFRQDMVERVEQAAVTLGYRPNSAALAFRSGRFSAVGLLLSTDRFRSSTPVELITALVVQLEKHGLRLLIGRVPEEDLRSTERLPSLLSEWSVDGFLVKYETGVPQEVVQSLRNTGLPCVWMNSKYGDDHVELDDAGAMYAATRELLRLGHRHIVYADFTRGQDERWLHQSRWLRLHGYRLAMAEAGLLERVLCVDPIPGIDAVPSARLHRESGGWHKAQAVIKRLLASDDRPTGWIGYSAREVSWVDHIATTLGLRVPEDLSLVATGYAGTDLHGIRLSLMDHNQQGLAEEACELLAARLAGRDYPQQDPVPLRWAPGGTHGPAPKAL